jgi:hypothetical protein
MLFRLLLRMLPRGRPLPLVFLTCARSEPADNTDVTLIFRFVRTPPSFNAIPFVIRPSDFGLSRHASSASDRGDQCPFWPSFVEPSSRSSCMAGARPGLSRWSGPKPDIEPPRHQEHQAERGHFLPHPLCGFVVNSYVGHRVLRSLLPLTPGQTFPKPSSRRPDS